MGFFSKVWKGIKTGVKGVVKGVKKAFKSVGKFFGKLGIVGQLALMFLLPGSGFLSGMGSWAAKMGAYTGFGAPVVNAAGKFLTAAVKVGNTITKPFRTVASGVMDVVKNTVGALVKKIPGTWADTFVSRLTNGRIDINDYSFKNAFDAVGKTLTQTAADVGTIFTPDKWALPESFTTGFDKQTAAMQLEPNTVDIVNKVDVPQIDKNITLDPSKQPQTQLNYSPSDLVTNPEVQLNTISEPVAEDLLQEAAVPRDNILGQETGSLYQESMDVGILSDQEYVNIKPTNVNQLEEIQPLGQKRESILSQPISEDVSQDKGYIQSKIDTGIQRASDKIAKVIDDPLGALAGVMGRQNDPMLQQGVYSYGSVATPTYDELKAPPSLSMYNQGQSPNALAFLGGQPASMLGVYHPYIINEAWRTG